VTWKNSIILGPCKLSSSSQFFTSHTTHILDIVPRVPSLYSCLFTEEVGRVLSARLEDLIDCEENSVIEIRDCGVETEAEAPPVQPTRKRHLRISSCSHGSTISEPQFRHHSHQRDLRVICSSQVAKTSQVITRISSISIACWVVVFSPQIVENFRRGSADGLSLQFIIVWLAGDVFNILGAVLQSVLPTMVSFPLFVQSTRKYIDNI
jgi:hypothetical protein